MGRSYQRYSAPNQGKINSQSRLHRKCEGSAVTDAFNRLGAIGLDRLRLFMLAAILMDLIPFTCSMALSFILGRRGKSGKKPQATSEKLHAVA